MTFLLSPIVMRAWLKNVIIREGVFASSTTIAFRCNLCYGIVPVNMSVVRCRLRQSSLNKSHAWKVSSSLLPQNFLSSGSALYYSPSSRHLNPTKAPKGCTTKDTIQSRYLRKEPIDTLSQQVTQEVQGGGAWRTATFI